MYWTTNVKWCILSNKVEHLNARFCAHMLREWVFKAYVLVPELKYEPTIHH